MLTRVFPSIVRIEVIRLRPSDGRLTKQWTAGSGVIISPEGHVVTNCHVTEDGDYFRCYLFDGSHVDAHLERVPRRVGDLASIGRHRRLHLEPGLRGELTRAAEHEGWRWPAVTLRGDRERDHEHHRT